MKCDLHVHTLHSGMCTVPVLDRICRESYNDPLEVYDILKRRGMDLVTVTDHDSIDAVEPLRRERDFFLSEEVSCSMTSGTKLHMGVYNIRERDHIELQRRRDDMPSLLAYLEEHRLLFSANHIFSGLTGARAESDFEEFASRFPAVETLNGQMLASANRYAATFATRMRKIAIGGSDAHTLACLGRTYTEVPGARNRDEFLTGLRQGRSLVAGESGNLWKLTKAVWAIGRDLIRERPWTWLLAPLMGAVPAATIVNLMCELAFARKWNRGLTQSLHSGPSVAQPSVSVIS
jgi:predicted metal-dependent phosphoesterase TrpH